MQLVPIQILLVDDEPQLLGAVSDFLRRRRKNWTVFTAKDGVEAMRLLRAVPIDILVADIQMPVMDGLSLLAQVRGDPALAHLPLILATALDERASVREGMAAGADDYLTKPYSVEELIQTIESRLHRQEAHRSSSQDSAALRQKVKRALTERELDVLTLIGRGLVTKEIALRLDLSSSTVSDHRANIMAKLDLPNAAALAALAVRAKLV